MLNPDLPVAVAARGPAMEHPHRPHEALLALEDAAPLSGVVSAPRHVRPGAALLCFLHGRGEAQPMDPVTAMTMHGPLHAESALDTEGLALPFVVVAPQLPLAGDLWYEQIDRVAALVRRIETRYATDPTRRYLTGFSFGGNGVFDLGHRLPGFWSALWAVDPPRRPEPDLAAPLWLSLGSSARATAAESVKLLHSIALGEDDDDAPPDASRVHLDQGEDHVGTARRAYADVRIYRWLLRHRRDDDEAAPSRI
jgi:predicted peptidase